MNKVLTSNNLPPNQMLLHITGRDGITPSTTISTALQDGLISGFFGNLTQFSFKSTIPLDRGISSFTIETKGHNDSSTIDTNGGHGFPVQDTAAFRLQDSCIDGAKSARNFTLAVSKLLFRILIAITNDFLTSIG